MIGIPNELIAPYTRQLWRHKWLSVALAWVICVIGWAAIELIPPKYESSARVYLSADQLLTPILNGVAINDDPARQLEYLQKTLLSRPNLEQVIHLSDLDLNSKRQLTPSEHEDLLQALAHDISIKLQTTNLLTLSYRNTDPVIARNVINSVVTVFAENSTGTNRGEMDNAKKFLDHQIDDYETQLRAAEKRRAQFHEKYLDLLPALDGAVSRLEAGRGAVAKLQLQVADARATRDALAHELEGIPKLLSVDSTAAQIIIAGKPLGVHAQLEEAQAKLMDLKTRFTDQYPDVIALRKQIADLEARAASEAAKPAAPSSNKEKTDVANPVYEQVKIRLVEAETALASQERALKQAQDEQAALEKKAIETPGVDAQAQDLDRDYAVKKKAYDELLAKREQTRIADAANTTADKIQFRIVDAPQVPVVPAAPNQPLLLLGVFVLAIGAAVAVPFVLLQIDKSFTTVVSLRALGLPVLGSVSRFSFAGARRRTRIQIATICASASALVAVFGVLLIISVNIYGLGISG